MLSVNDCCIISRRDGEENILLHFVKIMGQQERMDKRSRLGMLIVHDDIPRINWKLAVVERLITGLDGITRAAEIRTSGGKTN